MVLSIIAIIRSDHDFDRTTTLRLLSRKEEFLLVRGNRGSSFREGVGEPIPFHLDLLHRTSLKNDDNNVCFRQIKKTYQKKTMRESVNPSKTLAKLPRIFRISMRFSGANNMNQRLSQWYSSFTIGPYAIGERTCTYLWTNYDVRNSRPYLFLLQQRRYNGDIWRWVLKQQLLIEKNQLILSGHTRNLKHKRSPNRSLVEAERMSLGPKCCEQE